MMASGCISAKKLNPHDKLVIQSIFNPNTPHDEEVDTSLSTQHATEEDSVSLEWKKIERDAVELAEKGQLDEAMALFNKAIDLLPDKAANYNNRAQLWRLKGDVDMALQDLEIAVEKSGGTGAAACQAFVQRAMIKRLRGDENGSVADFKLAADLGSPFAKKQLVELNPYAALCNSMLSQMMKNVSQGEPTNPGDASS